MVFHDAHMELLDWIFFKNTVLQVALAATGSASAPKGGRKKAGVLLARLQSFPALMPLLLPSGSPLEPV